MFSYQPSKINPVSININQKWINELYRYDFRKLHKKNGFKSILWSITPCAIYDLNILSGFSSTDWLMVVVVVVVVFSVIVVGKQHLFDEEKTQVIKKITLFIFLMEQRKNRVK